MIEETSADFLVENAELSLAQRIEFEQQAGLSDDDLENVRSLISLTISENTKTSYRAQWHRFVKWAQGKGVCPFPANPRVVAVYLSGRMMDEGHKPATLKASASAIGFVHRMAGQDDPCDSQEVRGVLSGAVREMGKEQKQAEALTAEALARIHAVVYDPLRSQGGRLESKEEARWRGSVDMALMSLMRDGLLRVSEAAALMWADLALMSDGTGRLHIRRSKSDQEGEGAVMFVSAPTMVFMNAIWRNPAPEDSIFRLGRRQMTNRIKRAAVMAGLGDGFSGHSPRVGMARDLARSGTTLNGLMNAGRWSTSAMPARYTRNEMAARAAVAVFYGHTPNLAA